MHGTPTANLCTMLEKKQHWSGVRREQYIRARTLSASARSLAMLRLQGNDQESIEFVCSQSPASLIGGTWHTLDPGFKIHNPRVATIVFLGTLTVIDSSCFGYQDRHSSFPSQSASSSTVAVVKNRNSRSRPRFLAQVAEGPVVQRWTWTWKATPW